MEFKSLKIIEPLLRALEKEGYVEPTPIQEKTIPLLLDERDVIGIAQTGTGKTAAFVVPMLQKLYEKYGFNKATIPKALILAPTRELAAQISESFETYGKFLKFKHLAVYGGVGIGPQIRTLQHGVDILIATPGRLVDLMNQGKVNLGKVEFFTLDEADRMLDMGFSKDVNKIASSLPNEKQSLFFSATMSREIEELTRKFLKHPVKIEITPQSTPVEKIEQCVFFVDQENKNELLIDLIKQQNINRVLVFVGMKYRADKVVRVLNMSGIASDAIHGNKSQHQRTRALNNFKLGKVRVLVATDIAARGIDIENISHVINYDLPNEPENYIHRIGRTARAGSEGTAYSFCAAEDRNYLNQIERLTKRKTQQAEHKYHSVKAKSAEGKDAKPAPRNQSGRTGGRERGGGHGRSARRGESRDDGGRGNFRTGSRRQSSSRPNSSRGREGRSRSGSGNRRHRR
ncbi:MAG: DEAD/DEAH box helicase [archaeon]